MENTNKHVHGSIGDLIAQTLLQLQPSCDAIDNPGQLARGTGPFVARQQKAFVGAVRFYVRKQNHLVAVTCDAGLQRICRIELVSGE